MFGTWAMTVAALPALREAKGSVVNVASVAGVRPTGSSIPYAASKAALNHMTVLLAKVVGPEVRVNAVAPGLVDTPWTADWDFVREVVHQVAPLKRSGQPEDVAEVVVALARAAYVTGQVVVSTAACPSPPDPPAHGAVAPAGLPRCPGGRSPIGCSGCRLTARGQPTHRGRHGAGQGDDGGGVEQQIERRGRRRVRARGGPTRAGCRRAAASRTGRRPAPRGEGHAARSQSRA